MWIGLSKSITNSEIEKILVQFFPNKTIGIYDQLPTQAWPEITCQLHTNASEFHLVLELLNLPDETVYNTCLALAKLFSTTFHCRTICDGAHHGDDDSPYWSIVWDNGKSFLADDSGTKFADDEGGGAVKIMREIKI